MTPDELKVTVTYQCQWSRFHVERNLTIRRYLNVILAAEESTRRNVGTVGIL